MKMLLACLALLLPLQARAHESLPRWADPAMFCAMALGTGIGFARARDLPSTMVFGFFSAFTTLTCVTHIALMPPATAANSPDFQNLLRELGVRPDSGEAEDILQELQEGVTPQDLISRHMTDPAKRTTALSALGRG